MITINNTHKISVFKNRYLKYFNRCLPSSGKLVKFADRFKLIRRMDGGAKRSGVYEPQDWVTRFADFSGIYGIPKDDDEAVQFKPAPDVRNPWGSNSVIFMHPDLPYKYDWVFHSCGSIMSPYSVNIDSYKARANPGKYGYSEFSQCEKNLRALRFNISDSLPHRGANRFTSHSWEAVSSCLISQRKLYNVFGHPSFIAETETKNPKQRASYAFYDTLRRGVFFHVFYDKEYVQEYLDAQGHKITESQLADFWEQLDNPFIANNHERLTKHELLDIPFIVTVRAEPHGKLWSVNEKLSQDSLMELNDFQESYSQNLCGNYLKLFEIWLTQQFKHDNQFELSDADDVLYEDGELDLAKENIGSIHPLKLIKL